MQKSIRFCHVMHSMKRIEIPLSHIRDKNKFKSWDSLFPLVQCFKTNFVIFCIQCFKIIIYFIWFNVSRSSISHTHKKLFAFPFIIFTFTLLYTHVHSLSYHPISNTLRKKWCYLSSTFQWHLHNSNAAVSFNCNPYE